MNLQTSSDEISTQMTNFVDDDTPKQSCSEPRRAPHSRCQETNIGMRIRSGEPLLFEKSRPGRRASNLPAAGVPNEALQEIPTELRRSELAGLPELSELEVVRHFTRLSKLNCSIDEHTYPLGSCTMKYNPRVNEAAARLPGFARLHPETPESEMQGALELLYALKEKLLIVTGMHELTFAPAAGAHGELAGVSMMREALRQKNLNKDTILIPDSAHGTNPATCTLAGLKTRTIKTGPNGTIELSDLENAMTEEVGGIMVTNPNTLGLFETHIDEISRIIHNADGYVYMDGANLNALLGRARPGDFGVDAVHINVHKTFSTPHGGGGPGGGPVAVSQALAPFLPAPKIYREENGYFRLERKPEQNSIGLLREFYGNFAVYVRAYTYILRLGEAGLKSITNGAVINANYIRSQLENDYQLAYSGPSLHEVIFNDAKQTKNKVSTREIAKRLMDYGFHPPTVYFPLIVRGAMMIEPTESETKRSLDEFIAAMQEIAAEVEETPEIFANAPYTTPCSKVDETQAARNPVLRWETVPTSR